MIFCRPLTCFFTLLVLLASALVSPAAAYDIPNFDAVPFDRDGIFLEENERQSLLESLAAIASNFPSNSAIDEDVVEKSLAIALAIDPFHGNSRRAHDALAKGETPAPTSFFDSRSAAAESLWGLATELSSPPLEPEAEKLVPMLMEVALLVHPSMNAERVVEFASRSKGIDESWAGFVDLQPNLNDSNLKARSFRREAKDLRPVEMAQKPKGSAIFKIEGSGNSKAPREIPPKMAEPLPEIGPITAQRRQISGVFPSEGPLIAGTLSIDVREPKSSEESERFPFLLTRAVEKYPYLPLFQSEEAETKIAKGPLITNVPSQRGVVWQQGAVGELDFQLVERAGKIPRAPVQISFPLALSLLSLSESLPLHPDFGIIGSYDWSEEAFGLIPQAAKAIEIGKELEMPYLIVREDVFPEILGYLNRFERLELLFYSELLAVDSLQGAFDLVTLGEIPAPMKQASEIFAEIEMVSSRMSLPELARNEKVQERLEEILTLVPNHLSAKAMLEFGRIPISEEDVLKSAIREIDAVIDPYFSLRRESRAEDHILLSKIEEVDENLFKLRATIPPEARDYHDLASDMIEAAEIYLTLSNKETSIASQRLEQTLDLLEELIGIKVDLGMPIKRRFPRE